MNIRISVRPFGVVMVLLMLSSMGAQAQQGKRLFSLKEITNWHFSPRGAGGSFRSMVGGRYYKTLTDAHTAIVQYEFATGREVGTLFDLSQLASRTISKNGDFKTPEKIDDYQISPCGHHILIMTERERIYRRSSRSTTYHYDVRRKQFEPLSSGKLMIPTFSPD